MSMGNACFWSQPWHEENVVIIQAEFKVKVALAAIKGDHTLAELSTQFDLDQNQIIDWKNQLLEQSINIFSRLTAQQEPEIDLKALHAKIGHQALQIDFLEGALRKIGQLSGKKWSIRPINFRYDNNRNWFKSIAVRVLPIS